MITEPVPVLTSRHARARQITPIRATSKGWEDLCTHATAKTREAYELMRVNPRPREDGSHYELRGGLATKSFGGRSLEQWQIKVSGSGRIWYLPDDENHTVWIVLASVAHPKETE